MTESDHKIYILLEGMNKKLYKDDISFMNPKISPVALSSGRSTNVVTFSFREIILRMITNKNLFHPSNLLLDINNPFSDPTDDGYYGEVNTGTWVQRSQKSLVKPCYVVWNKNYCDGSSDKEVKEHDNTAYIVDPFTFWPQKFLHSD